MTLVHCQGEHKILALTRLPNSGAIHRQIDIRLCLIESIPYMLLNHTGDDALMRYLRFKPMRSGLRLNEYAMGPTTGTLVSPRPDPVFRCH